MDSLGFRGQIQLLLDAQLPYVISRWEQLVEFS